MTPLAVIRESKRHDTDIRFILLRFLVMKRMRKRMKRKLEGIVLSYRGKLLDDNNGTLEEMGVAADGILRCAMRICGGVRKKG